MRAGRVHDSLFNRFVHHSVAPSGWGQGIKSKTGWRAWQAYIEDNSDALK
jgi:hypothetical protein